MIIHTCLRLEIYSFDGEIGNLPTIGLAQLQGKIAVRRLIALMCGTQSEIIGETEIFGQVKSAIAGSINAKVLDKKVFWNLVTLIEHAELLRKKYFINCEENYSTVGANIISEYFKSGDKVLSIIGSGYMTESFFKTLKTKSKTKIYWINRNLDKAKDLQKKNIFLKNHDITHVSITDCVDVLQKSDLIFAASKNIGNIFSEHIFKKTETIVDVSYPPLFAENCNKNFFSINNTFFEKYIINPVEKVNLLNCEKDIDSFLN